MRTPDALTMRTFTATIQLSIPDADDRTCADLAELLGNTIGARGVDVAIDVHETTFDRLAPAAPLHVASGVTTTACGLSIEGLSTVGDPVFATCPQCRRADQ